jgi:hypothetical protein
MTIKDLCSHAHASWIAGTFSFDTAPPEPLKGLAILWCPACGGIQRHYDGVPDEAPRPPPNDDAPRTYLVNGWTLPSRSGMKP